MRRSTNGVVFYRTVQMIEEPPAVLKHLVSRGPLAGEDAPKIRTERTPKYQGNFILSFLKMFQQDYA